MPRSLMPAMKPGSLTSSNIASASCSGSSVRKRSRGVWITTVTAHSDIMKNHTAVPARHW
ncbi:hypothetical protein AZ54_01175 [Xanthomonas oryzae pv. oryzae PXO86]|nr:hypothetical protein AZ54_01175 [Xanthomonas oryzae pv. oryzae PXO86]AOS21618.1 hypothetical protein ATY47_01060 [Xanthomonas oryzae pv. oryzae]AOS29959.1 hypothetical protein ATY49_01055 [Xanthomonas oryzae pv. oryzae]